jgi:ADP-heptose:LPS heptosyltransferase
VFKLIGSRSPDPTRPQNVFVFRIGHFGDTVVALPAVHRIATLHPGASITLITNAPQTRSFVTAWDVLRHTRVFNDVFFYDAARVRDLARLVFACRRLQPAHLYYLPSPPRSLKQRRRDALFFRMVCGFRSITGLDTRPWPELRDPAGNLVVLPRECDRLLEVVDPSGVAPEPPYLKPSSAAEDKVTALLKPVAGKVVVAMGPGSKMPAKKWFPDRYLEIARRIVNRAPNTALVVFGGPEDRAECDQLVQAVGADRALNLAGATDIIESAAALARCAFFVGNDTGTMHLAAVMGLPCVAVFTSRENRDVWTPWGNSHTILRRDLGCSGCLLERCEVERMRCLDLISVDDVWAAVETYLSAPRMGAAGRGPATLGGIGR